MCEKKQKEQAQEEAKNEAFASLPQRQTIISSRRFASLQGFSFRWQYQQIFPMGRIFLGRGLGVTILNDLWIPGNTPNLLPALSYTYAWW